MIGGGGGGGSGGGVPDRCTCLLCRVSLDILFSRCGPGRVGEEVVEFCERLVTDEERADLAMAHHGPEHPPSRYALRLVVYRQHQWLCRACSAGTRERVPSEYGLGADTFYCDNTLCPRLAPCTCPSCVFFTSTHPGSSAILSSAQIVSAATVRVACVACRNGVAARA